MAAPQRAGQIAERLRLRFDERNECREPFAGNLCGFIVAPKDAYLTRPLGTCSCMGSSKSSTDFAQLFAFFFRLVTPEWVFRRDEFRR